MARGPRGAEPHVHVVADPLGDSAATGGWDPSPPIADMLAIARDPEPLVAGELLQDYSAPSEVIAALARAHPTLTSLAAGHPNAPVELKGSLAVREHSDLSLDKYVDARGGSAAQRHALILTYRGSDEPLGMVWDRDIARLP